MPLKTAYSTLRDPGAASRDLAAQLADAAPIKLCLYFASPRYDPSTLSAAMGEAFGEVQVMGCTTAGELVNDRFLKGSVVAMAFGADIIGDIAIETLTDLENPEKLDDAFSRFERHFGEPMIALPATTYAGLILIDGLCRAEERLMDTIGNRTNVIFIGASAGDDTAFSTTHVFANGKAHSNAAVLALLKPTVPFDFVKTESFRSTGKKLVATRVDESHRIVFEFDGKPAAQAYAEALGIDTAAIHEKFSTSPLGLMVGQEPFVRSPQRVVDGAMVFYCNVKKGMELELLESTDILRDTKRVLAEKKSAMKNVSGVVQFNCILRTQELEAKGLVDAYGKLFAGLPTVGFSTYGEEYIGHINQTAAMLFFG
jgi:hypothetical protein